MELTFVNQYGDSAPKRRRLAKACESCRARKKRCFHFEAANGESNGAETNTPQDSDKDGDDRASAGISVENGHRVFISDMTPQSRLLDRSGPLADKGERQVNEDIGVWIDKRHWEELLRQKNSAAEDASKSTSVDNPRPHSDVLAQLIDIYFKKVNPILPLLDESEFRRDHAGGTVPVPLVNAVCVVAAKDAEASPHLWLNGSKTPIAPREFCSRLYSSVVGALRFPCRFEKTTLIRLLALASLHAEGQDGAEDATLHLVQAIHYVQTLGWHLGQQSGVASGDELTTKRLFWCLWSMDRVNSCMYGRPIMMSDVDIAIGDFEPGESGFPAFESWLALSRLLNKIIVFYRPGNDPGLTGWESDFPSFEELLDAGKAWNEPQSVLMTLHLFYLLVAVLSHRSKGGKHVPRALPSYIRQSLCSIEIQRLMGSHLFKALHPLPILPHAISLALSVSYQHLRQAQMEHQRKDAREDFESCCQVLQNLRRTWPSADVMATIAKKVLEELNKATDLSTFQVGRFNQATRNSAATSAAPSALIDTGTDGEAAKDNGGDGGDGDVANARNPDGPFDPTAPAQQDWLALFNDMDQVLGTYLDPNYPVNLDDFSFLEDASPAD